MECGALNVHVRPLDGLGKSALRSGRSVFSPSARQLQSRKNFHIRAVSTESAPASLGRRARREQNVAGDFFVDRSCIDCDTCRWMAPEVFSRIGEQSAVHKQPTSPEGRLKALQALVSCPTGSIRTVTPSKDVVLAQKTFPLPIDEDLPGVYHCGFHHEASFAATSYFITRREGNVLIDSPRFNERLAKGIEELGGVQYMFLTHRDDVSDHKKWQKRFGCERILHTLEVVADTEEVEVKLEGTGPWKLGSDVELLFTPGHTKAHVSLLLKDRRVLFSGDHLYASVNNELFVDDVHNWYSVPLQVDSIEALIEQDFTWLLPGHGRRHKFEDLEQKNSALKKLVNESRKDFV